MTELDSDLYVLHNGTVLTGGETPEVWTDGAVAWSGSRIVAVGSEAELRAEYPEAMRLDARGGLVMPGLINLHHHLYSALARGLAPAQPPRDFGQILERFWWLLDRALTKLVESAAAGTMLTEDIRAICHPG